MAAPMEEPPCGQCGAAAAPYTCPRCNRRLCSLGCYRGHGACAEAFYREQVLQALAAERGEAPPERGRVQAALGRLRELREAGDPQAALGRGAWERLSPAERAEFVRMVRSGEALRLLPPWRPWWWRRGRPERLVEELGQGEEETGEKTDRVAEKEGKIGKKAKKVDEEAKKVNGKDTRDLGNEEDVEKEDRVAKKLEREAKNTKKEDRKAKGGHEEDKGDVEDSEEDVEERKEARKRDKMAKKRDRMTEKEAKMAKGDQKDNEDVEDEDKEDEEEEDTRSTEVDEDDDDDEGLADPMPPVPVAVPPLRSLRAAPASPLLRFQLPNVLYGYAFALCLHRGDRALLPEMASAALASAAALRARRPFASTAEALHDARREAEAAGYPPCPLGSAGTVLAVAQLLRGRRRRRPGEDAEAALQHLGRLLGAARRRLRGEEEERGRLGRARKKCLYLLAWSRERGAELAALAEEAARLHAEMAAAEAEVEALRGRLEAAWGGPRPPAPRVLVEEMGLRAAPASPLLRFQLPNVLYGYAFALCLHRGDRALLPEMASAALASAAALRARRPFASTAEALHDARREAEAAGYPPCPLGSAGTVLAVAQLLRGRRRRRPGEDAEAALQHLGRLLGAARRRLRGEEEERGRLGRARKKCLYLLAWSRERGAELAALAEEAARLHAEMAAAEAEVEALRGRLEAAWGGPRPPAPRVLVEEMG